MKRIIKNIPLFLSIFLVQCSNLSKIKVEILPYSHLSSKEEYAESIKVTEQKYIDKYFTLNEDGEYNPLKPFDNLFVMTTYRGFEISYRVDGVDCLSKVENISKAEQQSDAQSLISKAIATNKIIVTQNNSSLANGNLRYDEEQNISYLPKSGLPSFSLNTNSEETQTTKTRGQIEYFDDGDIVIDLDNKTYRQSKEYNHLTPLQRAHLYGNPGSLRLFAALSNFNSYKREKEYLYYVDDELFTIHLNQEKTSFNLQEEEITGTMSVEFISQINYKKLTYITQNKTSIVETIDGVDYKISETIEYTGYIKFPNYNFTHINYKNMENK